MNELRQQTLDLLGALKHGGKVICVHYACESFADVTDRPVAISAIAVTELLDLSGTQTAQVFAIANAAPNESRDEREKELLQKFFKYASESLDARWVHWNMNNATYGFNALADRYRYLTGETPSQVFHEDRLFDLDSIIGARYGDEFAKHPKFRNLCTLNGYFMPGFKDGKAEALAFAEGDFGACMRSCAEKSHLMARVLRAFGSGELQTSNSVGTVEFTGEALDAVKVVLKIGSRFLNVQRELARRRAGKPIMTIDDEYDAQDLVRSLLALFFDDVRPEEVAAPIAGGSSRIDFVLPSFELAIELKYTRSSMSDRDLGEELIIDRERYSSRKDVRHLVCLVFDHDGHLRNPRGLERDLSHEASTESFAVTVVIYDR